MDRQPVMIALDLMLESKRYREAPIARFIRVHNRLTRYIAYRLQRLVSQ